MPVPLPPPPSETVCVAARAVGAPIRAIAATGADPQIALVRAAIRDGKPPPPVDPASLVRAIPPAPTRERFSVRAAAAVDPADPTHGWLAVEAVTPLGRSGVPLHVTVLLDVSDSMHGVPLTQVPLLLDEPPGGAYRNVSRLEVARTALLTLVERLPSRADVSLVVFDRNKAESLLSSPTPAAAVDDLRFAIGRASQEVARKGSRTPLEAAYTAASASFDPCADNRILLVTDDNDQMDGDRALVERTVKQWADRGLEWWTLSIGNLGTRAPAVEALSEAGRGVVLYADTVAEATEPMAAALRATGAAVRAPEVWIELGPGVALSPLTGAKARWTLPDALDAGWRGVELYELTIEPAVTSGIGTVRARGSSPGAGEWTVDTAVPIAVLPLDQADPLVRTRVFAWQVGQALAGRRSWATVRSFGATAVQETGPAREMQAWVTAFGG